MSDEFEESRVFLELCYFTVSLITDSMPPIQFFKSDFVVLMQPIIQRFVLQFPGQTDREIISSQAYKTMVQAYAMKLRPLIDAMKQSGLWIIQGGVSISADPTELIGQVLQSDSMDIEQVLILRSVRINQLIYTPELTLYYNACLHCCQSPIILVRLYAYSLLRAAPIIVDLRHLFNVFKEATTIWNQGAVSFEFCASLFLLLSRFSEHRPSPNDANERELIMQLIVDLHKSANFEILMCFDTSLQWMYRCFLQSSIERVYGTAAESLSQGHYGDFVIICQCLALGYGDFSGFFGVVKLALGSVALWSHPIQKEARKALSVLPLRFANRVPIEIVNDISASISQSQHISEYIIFVFAEFLTSLYLGTSHSLNISLLRGLLAIYPAAESKKVLNNDIRSIIIALCSNPIRFLEVMRFMSNKKSTIFSVLKTNTVWVHSFIASFCSAPSYLFHNENEAKAVVKFIKEKSLSIVEKDTFSLYSNAVIYNPILIALFPTELRKIIEHIKDTYDEDMKKIIIEIFAIVVLRGNFHSECNEMSSFLPNCQFNCEYTELCSMIHVELQNPNTLYQSLSSVIDSSLSQFLYNGTASHTAVSLLFEHCVWGEGGEMLVVFKRLQLKPASWFSFALTCLFSSIVSNTEYIEELIKSSPKSAERFVWIGILVFRRLLTTIIDAITYERFEDLPKILLYPKISFKRQDEDDSQLTYLDSKYRNTLKEIFELVVESSKR